MEKIFYVLGTDCRLNIYGFNEEICMEEAKNRLYEIDDKMSKFKQDSEISGINKNAGIHFYPVSEDTMYVLERALEYAKLTDGAFDFTAKSGSKADYTALILDKENKSAMLTNPALGIDLGAIAKGYAADEIVKILRKHNIKSAIIDLGGNIYAFGKRPDGEDWRIGIQNPIGNRGEFAKVIQVSNKSVVTSGMYERPNHIIHPNSGKTANTEVQSVTVISEQSIDGDALTTSLFVMGKEKGEKLLEKLEHIEVIWMMKGDDLNVKENE